jgi:hypothetical protein
MQVYLYRRYCMYNWVSPVMAEGYGFKRSGLVRRLVKGLLM